jgi:hypothetical protein
MIRSPFLDIEIPDVSFTHFVLAGAEGLGDKPALIDASSRWRAASGWGAGCNRATE